MNDIVQRLTRMVEELEKAHETAVEELKREYPEIDPYRMRDINGKFILLDSLSALCHAHVLLTTMTYKSRWS